MMDDQTTEIEPVSNEEFSDWIIGMIKDLFSMLQNVSSPLFMTILAISAFVLVLGIILGSNRMRGAGGGGLVFSIIAFLIVRNAETIVGILESFTQNAP